MVPFEIKAEAKKPLVSIFKSRLEVEERAAEGLKKIEFRLSSPLPFRLEVPLIIEDGSAVNGEHFIVQNPAFAIFEANSVAGQFSGDKNGIDVLLKDNFVFHEGEQPSFEVSVLPVAGVCDVDESHGKCVVSIVDDENSPTQPVKVRFASEGANVSDSQLASQMLFVRADTGLEEDAEFTVSVLQKNAVGFSEVGQKTFRLKKGQVSLAFPFFDVIPTERLKVAGLANDDSPGPSTEVKVKLAGRHPLVADNPKEITFRVADSDPAVLLKMAIKSKDGSEITRIMPDVPFWVVASVDRPLRVNTPLQAALGSGDWTLLGILSAGKLNSSVGPFVVKADGERYVSVSIEVPSDSPTKSYVSPSKLTKKLPKGPKDSAKFGVVVVNTARLAEPGDGVLAATMASLARLGSRPYGGGAILVGPDAATINATAGAISLGRAFAPLSEVTQGLASQLSRVAEVIKKMREDCEDDKMRVIVIWAERSLSSPYVATELKRKDLRSLGPISFLCPDAEVDPEGAIRSALLGIDGEKGNQITVRCPRLSELTDHIRYAAEGFANPKGSK